MKQYTRLLLFAALAGLCTLPSHAQTKAQMNGTTLDTSGSIIPGVRIVVLSQSTGVQWTTDSDDLGRYLVPLLQPGTYTVTATKSGFRTSTRAGVKLDVAQTATLDFTLSVGDVTERIEVHSTAELLDTGTPAIGQVVDSAKVANLPTNGRSPWAFITLVPGVRAPSATNQPALDYYSYFFISINGSRPNQNQFFIDSGNNSTANFNGPALTPSLEGVEEFKVQTNNFSAENANAAGGVVNLVTRSGTNEFHGSLYEFLRNDKLDAKSFFQNRSAVAKVPYRFNQFGGSFGGPVVRNRTFFFFTYEGIRRAQASVSQSTLPTTLQKGGDFSQTLNSAGKLIVVYDPSTTGSNPNIAGSYIRSPFPDNKIPSSRLNPVSLAALQYYPAANRAGDMYTNNYNYVVPASTHTTKDNYSGRGDHTFNDRNRIFGRYSYDHTPTIAPNTFGEGNPAGSGRTDDYAGWNSTLNYTSMLSPTFYMELSSTFNRYILHRDSAGYGFDPTKLGMPASLLANSMMAAFPTFTISGYATLGSGNGRSKHGYDRFEERANLTRVHGRHTLKFGGVFGVMRASNTNMVSAAGAYDFTARFTQGPNPLTVSTVGGSGLASYLLGVPNSGSHNTIRVGMSTAERYTGGYLQDDFQIRPKLTVNLGIRYDFGTPRAERYNQLSNFDYSAASTLSNGVATRGGLIFPGTNGLPRGNWDTDTNNIAPRLGFAYSLNDKTVFRGGYGIFFSQMNGGGYNSNAVPNTGFNCVTNVVASADGGLTPYVTLSNPFPTGFCGGNRTFTLAAALGQDIDFIDRGDRTPYSQQWNFNIQRQLPGKVLMEVSYAGNHGLGLIGDLNYNQLPESAMALGSGLLTKVANPYYGLVSTGNLALETVTRAQLLRPYPQYTALVSRAATYGSSIYHAMLAKFERRLSNGFTFLASYTWSKLIDDVPPTTTGFPGESFVDGTLQNYNNRAAERALATFDTPHQLAISSVLELPFGAQHRWLNNKGLAEKLLGGWQMNWIATFQSGPPMQIVGGNSANAFAGTQRPNWSGKNASLSGRPQDRLSHYFDTSQFWDNTLFTFGNSPRVMPNLRGDGVQNLDMSFFRTVRLRERLNLQIRAEAFNLLNTPQFGIPNSNVDSTSFGVITSQRNVPRDLQFALKLMF